MRHTFLLLLALIAPLAAQTEKKKDSGIKVRFLAEIAPEALGKVAVLAGKEVSPPFDLPTKFLSDPVGVAQRSLVLRTAEKQAPLCTINLPEAGSAFAVVLVSAKPSGYQPIVVRTDDPKFKSGDVLFINRSDKIILGKLGTAQLILKAGQSQVSRPEGAKENAYYDVAFAARDQAGVDKVISSSRWPVEQHTRSYLFFFNDANGKVSFRSVDEYLDAPAAKAP